MEKVLQQIADKLQRVDTLEKRLTVLDENVTSLAKTGQELTQQKSRSPSAHGRDKRAKTKRGTSP
jgi:archaellum component FlaC